MDYLKTFFVPTAFSKTEQENAIGLIIIIFIQMVAGIVFAPIYYFLGYQLAAAVIIVSVLLALVLIFLVRLKVDLKMIRPFPAFLMYSSVFSLNVIQGGFEAPTTMWFTTVPVLAIVTGSVWFGIYWSVIASVTVVFFYISPILGISYIPTPLDPEEVRLLYAFGTSGLVLYISGFALANEIIKQKNLKKIDKLAGEDPLTRLYTRRRFFEKVKELIEKDKPLSLAILMIDIDRFKMINDNFGHHIGDMILETFGNLCRDALGEEDLGARFGGEEFVLILPGQSQEAALDFAQRLRNDIADKDFTQEGECYKITVSIGLKHEEYLTSIETFDAMLISADTALYDAKREGRNKVCTL